MALHNIGASPGLFVAELEQQKSVAHTTQALFRQLQAK